MTCEEFLRRLDDGCAPADREAAEHARSCPTCGRALARWQTAQRELRAMSSEDAPPFLHARVMAHLRAEATGHRRPGRLRSLTRTVLATAAVAVVAALAGYEVLRQRSVPLPPAAPEAKQGAALPPAAPARSGETAGAGPEARPVARPAPPRADAAKPLLKAAPPAAARNLAAGAPPVAPAPEGGAAVGESAPGTSFARQATDAAAPAAMPEGAAVTVQERRAAATGVAAGLPVMEAAETGRVACVLRAGAGGRSRVLDLPAAWAPPAGMEWTVTVGSDGAVGVADARGADVGRLRSGLRARLAALGLPPGRYLLTRRSE